MSMMLQRGMRKIGSIFRRAFRMRASGATLAAVELQLTFLGQEGIRDVASRPELLNKPLCELTEAEALELIRDCRVRMRRFVREYNAHAPVRGGAA